MWTRPTTTAASDNSNYVYETLSAAAAVAKTAAAAAEILDLCTSFFTLDFETKSYSFVMTSVMTTLIFLFLPRMSKSVLTFDIVYEGLKRVIK